MKKQLVLLVLVLSAAYILQSCGHKPAHKEQPPAGSPVLLSGEGARASCVFLTSDEQNNPFISWVETGSSGDIHFYLAAWDASSNKFGQGFPIPIAPNTSIHEEGMPKMAIKGDGTIVAVYETSVPSANSRFGLSDINYMLSFDKGKTWTSPRSIQPDAPHTGSRSFCNIIRLDDGEVGAAWLGANPDGGKEGRPVKFAKTTKNGGFGDAVLIESFACQCCRTALSRNGSGQVSVVFRDLLPGSVRDISVSKSFDNGRTFSAAAPFSNNNWVIDGCPHNGPSVAGSGDKTFVTWFTGSDHTGIFYAELDKHGHMRTKRRIDGNGRFSQLCLMPDGDRIIAYNKSYREEDSVYSRIMVTRINNLGACQKEITPHKVYASFPVVQPAGDDQVIVAWSGAGKVHYKIIKVETIDMPVAYEEPLAYRQFETMECSN